MTDKADYFIVIAAQDEAGNLKCLSRSELYGNENPLYLEIGSGKGEFISQYSLQHPDINILGLEAADKRIRNTLKKLNPETHINVRLMRLYVNPGIKQLFPPESIAGVFIQHPDPWPKRKHHKRRLIQQDFLNALAHILMPEAIVQISTDHAGYAAWIAEELMENPNFATLFTEPVLHSSTFDSHIITWYEAEQRRQGYEPQFMLFKRI